MRRRWGFLHFRNRKSSNILKIEYQMLVLAHTDLRKYEATIGFLVIFYKQKIYPTSLFFLSANVINLINH